MSQANLVFLEFWYFFYFVRNNMNSARFRLYIQHCLIPDRGAGGRHVGYYKWRGYIAFEDSRSMKKLTTFEATKNLGI